MCSYDGDNITLAIFIAATQFKDANHVELPKDGHMRVDDITTQLTVQFIWLGRMEEHITYGEDIELYLTSAYFLFLSSDFSLSYIYIYIYIFTNR